MSGFKPRTAVIPPIRVTERELAQIKRNASRARLTTAAWVRAQALAEIGTGK